MNAGISSHSRRHDLDFVRVFAFALLVPYHASLFFGTRPFYVNADEPSRLFDLFDLVLHPWRMTVLFFLSGIATAMLKKKMPLKDLWRERTRRILTPFILGMLICAPPQFFVVNRVWIDPEIDFWQSWPIFFHLVPQGGGSDGYNVREFYHLWFLPYLFAYVGIWLGFKAAFPTAVARLRYLATHVLTGPLILALPIAFYASARAFVYPQFSETLNFQSDWYLHLIHFTTFVLGYLIAFEDTVWNKIAEVRHLALAVALIATAICAFQAYGPDHIPPASLNPVARAMMTWCAVVALFGCARVYVTKRNAVISYLNKGVLSYYVTHQTVMVLVAYWLHQKGLLTQTSYIFIVLFTALVCALLYEGQRQLMAMTAVASVGSGVR